MIHFPQEPRRPARLESMDGPPTMKRGCLLNGVVTTVLMCALIYGSLLL